MVITKLYANIGYYYNDNFKKLPFRYINNFRKLGSIYKIMVEKGNLKILRKIVHFDKGQDVLPTNQYCKFIGECGINFGIRFSKIISQNFDFIKFLIDFGYLDKFSEIRRVLLNWRQVVTGGIDSCFNHLVKFTIHEKEHIVYSAEELVAMVERNKGCWLKQPFIDHFYPVDLNCVKMKMDSKPGLFTSKIFGYIRRFSYKHSIKLAIMLLQEVFDKPMIYTGLWELGAREKDINLDKEGLSGGARIVMMCEEVLTIISGYFVQCFTKHVQLVNDGCMFIGRKFDYENISKFNKLNEEYDFCIDGDWDNFDANVLDEYILAACAILRRSLPGDKKYHRYMFFIAASLIIKFVAVPPNRVFRIIKGIPSGHGFTTLVGSMVNYLYILQIGEGIYGRGNVNGNMFAVVSGDDVKIWLKYHKNIFNINNIVDMHIPSECGDLLKNLIPCKVNSSVQIYTKFLKRKIDSHYNVVWDKESFFRKVIYSKRSFRFYSEIIDWMKMWIETAPFDSEINEMCLNYIKYKSKGGTTLRDTNKEFLFSMLDKDFNKIIQRGMTKVLCPKVMILSKTFDAENREIGRAHV